MPIDVGSNVLAEPSPTEEIATDTEDTLYDVDFYTWSQRQAALLKGGRLDELDIANIAEEVESLGRSQASSLESAYHLICLHQLKRLFSLNAPQAEAVPYDRTRTAPSGKTAAAESWSKTKKPQPLC